MASSRRTYDTDVITLRTVFAKSLVNSNIPALRVLTADGAGGTYWAIPSSLGQNPSFNEIITSAGTYTADLSYNRFRLLAGEGIGMVNGPAGSNQTTLFGKAFNTVDVSGANSFYSFTNNTVTPYIRFATTGAIQARTDPTTNTLFIDGPVSNPYIVSTGQYGFYQIKVTPAASTITSTVQGFAGDFITANSPSTLLRMLGYNDIQLSTNVTTNSIFFTISTFTSKGYLDISAAAFSAYPSTLSTVSSLYVQQSVYSSTVASLSSGNGITFSTLQSSINGLAMSTGDQFYILSGLIAQRAYINQLNSDINTVNLNNLSTVAGLGQIYISTSGGGGGGGSGSVPFLSSFIVSTGSFEASSITTSSLLNYGTLSTHSLVVYGASTLRVQGLSYFENILSSYSVLTPSLGILDATSGNPIFITANNGTISFNGSGGNGGILDTQIASTLQYSSEFSSIKLGYNAGYTGQSNNAIAIGNRAGSNGQGENSIAIGANAGSNNQSPSSIILSAMGDALNATTEGFFVGPVRTLFTSYDYALGYNSTSKEVGMIDVYLPRFNIQCIFNSNGGEIGGGGNFNQVLALSNFTWTSAAGIGTPSNYRVHISWVLPGISENALWYFAFSNVTQGTFYYGSTYNQTSYSTALTVQTSGLVGYYLASSYTDIFTNMSFVSGDTFQPLLYMGTQSSNMINSPAGKVSFSIEFARSNF
jgi:hypothetical protein